MRLYVIRHGDPDYEHDALTPRGEAEVQALAAYLPRLGITHIYCSPLGRAKATCAPCAQALGLPVQELDWARELTGVYYEVEGFGKAAPFTLPGEVTYGLNPWPRYRGWQEQAYFDHPQLGRLIRQMEEGSDALLKAHGYEREGARYRVIRPNASRVAVFCHHGIGTSWMAYLLRIPYQAAWAGMWQACTSFAEISMECLSERYAVPRLLRMGATPHLDLAGLSQVERGLATSREAPELP